MKYAEIYSDNEGVSHFGDAEVNFHPSQLQPKVDPVSKSDFVDATAGFLSVVSGWDSGWHNSPGDGFAILLQGTVEIEVGSGEVRRFAPGDVWRSMDINGAGHISRVIGASDAKVYMTNFANSEDKR